MIIAMILMLAVGLLCLEFGFLLWKKQRISLIHDYQTQYVKEEDIPAYTKHMGIALCLMGAGILACGILILVFQSLLGMIPLCIVLPAGIFLLIRAQLRFGSSTED